MDLEHYEIQSEFLRGIMAKNREAGRIAGLIESVLCVLEARGISVSQTVKARVVACTDADVLEGWLRLAVKADAAEDVLGE